MKKQIKKSLKKYTSAFASLALALVLVVGFAFSPAAAVSAAVSEIEVFPVDETNTVEWTGEGTEVYFDVEESGFYQLNIVDNYDGEHILWAFIYDERNDSAYIYVNDYIDEYTSEMIFIPAGEHLLRLSYFEEDYDAWGDYITVSYPGSVDVSLESVDFTPPTLTSSYQTATFAYDEYTWFSYTPTTTGDYTITFNNTISSYINVYNASNGDIVYGYHDTEYIDEYGEWIPSNKATFNLKTNTTYYFAVSQYGDESTITRNVLISKNDKAIKNVEFNGLNYDINVFDRFHSSYCNYKVTFTNGTTSVYSYTWFGKNGYEPPYSYAMTEEIYVNGYWLVKGGKTPVVTNYNGVESISYVYLPTLTEYFSYLSAVSGNQNCYLPNEGGEQDRFYRIKTNYTGSYSLRSYDSFSDKLDYWSFEILDSQNNIVEFDNDRKSWPLIGGQEYVLAVNYEYINIYSSDITFWLSLDSQVLFSDTATSSNGGWYNDAIHYVVGQNIMSGYGGTSRFGTGDNIQRQDFLVMLARLDGVYLDWYDYDSEFTDVPTTGKDPNCYYRAAINWGYECGIVSGYQDGSFGVGDTITREQLVAFLYRYAKYRCAETDYTTASANSIKKKYTDFKNVSDWAQESVLWAVDKGVINGKTATTLVPYGNALRCEVAQIMYNIFKKDIL